MPKYRHVWRTLPVRAACSSARVLRRISCCALDTVSLLPGRTQVSNEVGNVYTSPAQVDAESAGTTADLGGITSTWEVALISRNGWKALPAVAFSRVL